MSRIIVILIPIFCRFLFRTELFIIIDYQLFSMITFAILHLEIHRIISLEKQRKKKREILRIITASRCRFNPRNKKSPIN